MINTDRILDALRLHGDLDDDELSMRSGVRPRQQVNQLCRSLEAAGRLERVMGASGKLVNRLTVDQNQARPVQLRRGPSAKAVTELDHASDKSDDAAADPSRTLLVLPCSARKATGGETGLAGVALHGFLSTPVRERLQTARSSLASASHLNDDLLLPAYQRYRGHLYGAAAAVLHRAVNDGLHVLIISGGYGLVHAAEPIGWYERVFSKRDWPAGVLADAIAEYARAHDLRRARAFLASSTSYRKLLDDVDWPAAGITDAQLLTPVVTGGGSMVKAPRALGEALSAYLQKGLASSWRSSDGTEVRAFPIGS